MSNLDVVETRTRRDAIAGVGVRPDGDLRRQILSDKPDWDQIIKELCRLEGLAPAPPDTIALFKARCPSADQILQIASMIAARPRVIQRAALR